MKKKRDKYLIRTHVEEMAADAVVGHIGQDRYELIKHEDFHPFFFGSRVAHEGVSTGKIEGRGDTAKLWPAGAIISLARRLNESLAPVFLGHGGNDRTRYGQVISGFAENGEALAVGYIEHSTGANKQVTDRVRSGELDANSIEADLVLCEEADGSLVVESVEKVTGLALGDSRFTKPGFPEARVLAAVQEFEDDQDDKNKPNPEENEMKLPDVMQAVRENGWKPDQIYGNDQLLEATPVIKALESRQQEADKARKEVEKITGERDKLAKTNEELTGKLSGFEAQGQVADRIKTAKLTEKEAGYVEKQMREFVPEGGSDDERGKAIDTEIKQHSEVYQEYFADGKKPDGEGKPAGESQDKGGESTDPNDLSQPENNPLIPGSPAEIPAA